eukprot:m.671538 g.671538  ORF g.671538 m.671538 type:complete len:339 (+) comp22773_c0_seq4:255-1271(+)
MEERENVCAVVVDWGTTNMRATIVDTVGAALETRTSTKGLMHVAKQLVDSRDESKVTAFESVLEEVICEWANFGVPIILLGMVGSKQGWVEASYMSCPAALQDLSTACITVPNSKGLNIRLLPGLCSTTDGVYDVMRGEETQILGLLQMESVALPAAGNVLVCLPGTHSKWVTVDASTKTIVSFKTFMTGEMFDVMSKHSILKLSVSAPPASDSDASGKCDIGTDEDFLAGFKKGYNAKAGELPHALFTVRTRHLFSPEKQPSQHRSYLSGLLIGAEFQGAGMTWQADDAAGAPVYIVGSSTLCETYRQACAIMQVPSVPVDALTASIKGALAAALEH